MPMPRLLFVTNSYPQEGSAEKGFLFDELRALAASGVAVTLAPVRRVTRLDPDLPEGVSVTDRYARAFSAAGVLRCLLQLPFDRDFRDEIARNPRLLTRVRFWKEAIRMRVAKRVFGGLKPEFDCFYTYWFTADTIGLARAGARPLMSRAHGYDLYEEVSANGGHIPFRRRYVDRLDLLFTLSRQAATYASDRFGVPSERIEVVPIGVASQESKAKAPAPSDIVFVSCAFPSPNKRLAIIREVIRLFATQHPRSNVSWHHFGATLDEIGGAAHPEPANLSLQAWGRVPRARILDFYRREPVSFFVNLSLSEGQPVSAMEAMSFGIPVLATAVGGVPEMLEQGGGVLVGNDMVPAAIAERIASVTAQPGWRERLGDEARRVQQTKFDSAANGRNFAALVLQMTA